MRRLLPAWIVLALTAGLLALTPAGPAAADAPWCSTSCNGKSPTASVTLLNGAVVKCINSAVVASGPYHPHDPVTSDPYISIWHMYSNSCQTTWLKIVNSKALGRISCYGWERRYVSPTYQTPNVQCGNVGQTILSPMVNDHDDAGNPVAYGYVFDRLPAGSLDSPLDVRTDAY